MHRGLHSMISKGACPTTFCFYFSNNLEQYVLNHCGIEEMSWNQTNILKNVPLNVGRVETLQASQFLVDDFQFSVEELGLVRVWRYPFQLPDNLFSYSQVLIMNGVQIFVNILDINLW